MKKLTLLVLLLGLSLAFTGCGLFGFGSDAPDIQGTWNVSFAGATTTTMEIQQSGTSISGTMFGFNFEGTVSSDTVEMDFITTGERMEASVNPAGTSMSNGRFYSSAGELTHNWTAQKQ